MEKIFKFIENNPSKLFYKIINRSGQKISLGSAESTEELKEAIESEYDMLPDGKFSLLLGSNINMSNNRSLVLEFTKGEAKQTFQRNQTSNSMQNGFSYDQVQEMILKAREEGRKEAEIEMLKRQVSDLHFDYKELKKDFENFKKTVANKFDELDGIEDNDILSKGIDTITKLNEAKNALSGFDI